MLFIRSLGVDLPDSSELLYMNGVSGKIYGMRATSFRCRNGMPMPMSGISFRDLYTSLPNQLRNKYAKKNLFQKQNYALLLFRMHWRDRGNFLEVSENMLPSHCK